MSREQVAACETKRTLFAFVRSIACVGSKVAADVLWTSKRRRAELGVSWTGENNA